MAAPLVSATLALIAGVRPELQGSALKAALLAGARPSSLLDGLLEGGALDAAGALRAVLGPTDWNGSLEPLSASALPTPRTRRRSKLRWTLAGDTAAVAKVRIVVGGRVVSVRSAAARPRLRVRARAGLHRWTVVAVDAAGAELARADGRFRVLRRPR